MNLQDNFAFIPLVATAAAALIDFILLIIVKKRSTARISIITFIADILLCIGSVYAALFAKPSEGNALSIFACLVFAGMFCTIPYLIILCTFQPKKIEKLVPPSKNAEKNVRYDENGVIIEDMTNEQMSLFQISKDFQSKASQGIVSEKGMNDLLDYVNKTIRDTIKADGGAILLVDDFDDVIAVKSFDGDFPPPYELTPDIPHKPVRVSTNFKFKTFPLRESFFGEVAISGKAELITKPEKDSRIFQNGPEDFLKHGSYILIPMKQDDNVIGVAAFSRKYTNPVFTEEDLKNAENLCLYATYAVKTMIGAREAVEKVDMTKETEIASKIQNMMHPEKLPAIPGTQTGTFWSPASGVCGDFYDVIYSRKDRASYIISDIAGKGMNSVLIMVMVRAMLRLVTNTTQTAGTILTWVNKGICAESYSTDHFGSVALINYDPQSQQVQIASGGVIPVLYYDSEKDDIMEITEKSEPIGVEKTTIYKDYVQNVKSGDIIVTYTDGLIEALNENGAQYSKEKLISLVKSNHEKSGKDIASLVKADIKKFSGNESQHDDQTLLVVKIQ